jgi:pimeloyl-ACP methyl ester carboxylesterase
MTSHKERIYVHPQQPHYGYRHKYSSLVVSKVVMPPLRKPTLVIVHGGWHDPSSFDAVRKPLELEGFKCHVPALPSIGELSATKTASDDVNMVHSIIEKCLAQGEDVVVVGHSNGGLKANGALKGLVGHNISVENGKGRVLGLALIAALLPPIATMGASDEKEPHLDQSRWTFSVSNSSRP